MESHGCFGYLYFDKGLRGGETTRYTGYVYMVCFQGVVHYFRHIGIYADCGHIVQIRVLVNKFVYLSGEFHHAFIRVGALQSSQVNAMEQEFLHVRCIVFCYMFLDEQGGFRLHILIAQMGVILGKRFFVLAVVGFVIMFHNSL